MNKRSKQKLGLTDTIAESAEPAAEPTGGDIANNQANTMLPSELLQGGEIIILLIKPSAWYIVLESLGFIFIIVAVLIAAGVANNFEFASEYIAFRDLLLVAFGLLSARIVWQFLEWLSRVYVLTDRRIIRVRGVLRVNVFETSFKRIQHTNTSFSLRERLFGLGTIGFSTAGSDGIEASWEMLGKPLEVHKIVVQTLNRYR